MPIATAFSIYYAELREFKRRLFGLFAAEGAVLELKDVPASLGTTWGYWLAEWNGRRPVQVRGAASIGEDEIKLFYDLCQMVQPRRSFVIGNSFGLSTFCLSLAWPAGQVVAIDTWGDEDTRTLAKPLFEQIVRRSGMAGVQVFTGMSPRDTAAAMGLFDAANGAPALSIAFIDGLHRNPAALEDFEGLLPYLDRTSVVLWHNVSDVRESFDAARERHGGALFDQHLVLRTHGPLGIDFSSEAHPALLPYLRDCTLIWNDWRRYMNWLEEDARQRWAGGNSRGALWRAASAARRAAGFLAGRAR